MDTIGAMRTKRLLRRKRRGRGLVRFLRGKGRLGESAVKLLDQVRHAARVKHYSYRTEQSYVQWTTRCIRFHGIRHPNTMGTAEIEAFLTHLAVDGHVAASTQNQVLNALVFLYRVLGDRYTTRADCSEQLRQSG